MDFRSLPRKALEVLLFQMDDPKIILPMDDARWENTRLTKFSKKRDQTPPLFKAHVAGSYL